KELAQCAVPGGPVESAQFSPNGRGILTLSEQLVNGQFKSTVALWDAQTGRERKRYFNQADKVVTAVFGPKGTHLLTAGWDKTARLWDVRTGREVVRFSHKDWVLSAAFAPDGKRVVTVSGKNVRVWDAQTGNQLALCQGAADSAVF